MPIVKIKLAISSAEYSRYYRGHANKVICQSIDGRTIQFPAAVLRPYLTHDGIYGEFKIEFTAQNKFLHIEKIT